MKLLALSRVLLPLLIMAGISGCDRNAELNTPTPNTQADIDDENLENLDETLDFQNLQTQILSCNLGPNQAQLQYLTVVAPLLKGADGFIQLDQKTSLMMNLFILDDQYLLEMTLVKQCNCQNNSFVQRISGSAISNGGALELMGTDQIRWGSINSISQDGPNMSLSLDPPFANFFNGVALMPMNSLNLLMNQSLELQKTNSTLYGGQSQSACSNLKSYLFGQ